MSLEECHHDHHWWDQYRLISDTQHCSPEIDWNHGKGTDDSEFLFGGLNVIAVRDVFQLPPVGDKFIFQEGNGYNPGYTHLWRYLHNGDHYRWVTTLTLEYWVKSRTGQQTNSRWYHSAQDPSDSGINTPVDVEQSPFTDALHLLLWKSWLTNTILTVFSSWNSRVSSPLSTWILLDRVTVSFNMSMSQRDSSHPLTMTVLVYQEVLNWLLVHKSLSDETSSVKMVY